MADHEPKAVSAVCETCHMKVGTLTVSAHGRPQEAVHGNDSTCTHPPYAMCPHFLAAFRKARALVS